MENSFDWLDLLGLRVHVKKDGKIVRTGFVDAVTPSADILWIGQEGAAHRSLYEKYEGYTAVSIWEDLYDKDVCSQLTT
ncbi:hypothetical protein [Arthrobacter sp. NPDC057013]|uniref:hypothetical protein n=1 Tax=Arthrobacter sp. NPDC057013 TaxID=3345999 RepID=UPI00364223EF